MNIQKYQKEIIRDIFLCNSTLTPVYCNGAIKNFPRKAWGKMTNSFMDILLKEIIIF